MVHLSMYSPGTVSTRIVCWLILRCTGIEVVCCSMHIWWLMDLLGYHIGFRPREGVIDIPPMQIDGQI